MLETGLDVGDQVVGQCRRCCTDARGRFGRDNHRQKCVAACRQAGVACHAVVGEEALDSFRERLIDLSTVTEAGTLRRLRTAGRRLAAI